LLLDGRQLQEKAVNTVKLYVELLKLLLKKYILRKETGTVIKDFCVSMGLVYIKLGQILATQNFGKIFKETDRQLLSSVCDNCKPVSFTEIKQIIESEYKCNINEVFDFIDETPLGSASISQVHKAALKNGKAAAVKVKRKDVTAGIEKDIEKIKKFIRKFGKIAGIKNLTGGDTALDLYLTWIKEEADFENEKQNIIRYGNFASSVNGRVRNTKNILVPKVVSELCTENIIVMDYIDSKTINQLELDVNNKNKIREALNSYLQLSFYALFHDKKIILHGDPHGGNIYIDDDGNIGFLDMGLIFEMSESDSELTRKFFLSAYSNNHEKIQNLLIPYGNFDKETEELFRKDTALCCDKIQTMPVTSYFTEFIAVVSKYDMIPPVFLFSMAKAFICLNGINVFSENITNAAELLKQQIIEFLLLRSIQDSSSLVIKGLEASANIVQNVIQYGMIKGLTDSIKMLDKESGFSQEFLNFKETADYWTYLIKKENGTVK
jgi:ubiquinone biosynthesis protein